MFFSGSRDGCGKVAGSVKFSVVVPTCNRPDLLQRCLETLAPGRQSLSPALYEVVVTNDGQAAVGDVPWARITTGPKRGPAANRNHGARLARGEWIVFTDDDCVPCADWLIEYARAADSGNAEFLEGRVDAQGWTGHPMEERVENQAGGVFWSCNIAVQRGLFERSGGFDEDFQQAAFEDMEFAARLKKLGARTAFVPRARVEHPVRRVTLSQMWRRRLMLRWYALFLRKTGVTRSLAAILLLDLFHGLRRDLRRFKLAQWGPGLFQPAWELATFPLIFPYVLLWDRRFRRSRSLLPGR